MCKAVTAITRVRYKFKIKFLLLRIIYFSREIVRRENKIPIMYVHVLPSSNELFSYNCILSAHNIYDRNNFSCLLYLKRSEKKLHVVLILIALNNDVLFYIESLM